MPHTATLLCKVLSKENLIRSVLIFKCLSSTQSVGTTLEEKNGYKLCVCGAKGRLGINWETLFLCLFFPGTGPVSHQIANNRIILHLSVKLPSDTFNRPDEIGLLEGVTSFPGDKDDTVELVILLLGKGFGFIFKIQIKL